MSSDDEECLTFLMYTKRTLSLTNEKLYHMILVIIYNLRDGDDVTTAVRKRVGCADTRGDRRCIVVPGSFFYPVASAYRAGVIGDDSDALP